MKRQSASLLPVTAKFTPTGAFINLPNGESESFQNCMRTGKSTCAIGKDLSKIGDPKYWDVRLGTKNDDIDPQFRLLSNTSRNMISFVA